MARELQILVRDPTGAVWNLAVKSGDTVGVDAGHSYRISVDGKPGLPSGTTVQRVGSDLRIRFADGEEITLTGWGATAGASLDTRGARLVDEGGRELPGLPQVDSGAIAVADADVSAAEPVESAVADAASPAPPEPAPAPVAKATPKVEAAVPPAPAETQVAVTEGPAVPATSAPPPSPLPAPLPPPPVAAGGGMSGTAILGGLGGLLLLGAAAGGGGGSDSSSGAGTPTPPTTPAGSSAPSELTIVAASDSGVPGDRITNDTTPTISGRADPNANVTLRNAAGTTIATATADASGNWTATPSAALPNGATTLSVVANRGGGATDSPATSFTVSVDTAAPAAPTVQLAASSDSGTTGDNRTNDATPTISGTGTAGDTVRLSLPGGSALTTTVAANGSWSVTPTTVLVAGANALSAIAIDPAGNPSAAAVLTVTVDTAAPSAPAAQLAASSDSGVVGDGRTNDTTPTISGTGAAGDTIRVTLPGGTVLTTTVAANGTWSVTPTAALASGANVLAATATDAAGNVSAATALTVTIVTTGPAAPAAQLAATSDSGAPGDSLTNDTTPTISGTGAAGDTIRVTLPGGTVLTTTVASNGTWSVTPASALASGANLLSATATDSAGNVSAATALTVTIDNTAPAGPVPVLAPASDSGTTGDSRTNDTTPTISGTGAAGDTIRVTLPGGTVLTTTVAANGTWSVTPTAALASGANLVSATATDPAGNVSASSTLTVTVDTTAPAAPASQLAAGSDSGTPGDNRTNDTTPTISGTGVAGDTIRVTLPGGTVLTTTVAVNGSWSVTPAAALAQGVNVLSVTATDAAGNVSSATSLSVTIDTTAPAAPTLGVPEGPVISQAENADGIVAAVTAAFVTGDTVAVVVTRPDSSSTTVSRAVTAGEVIAGVANVTVPTQALQGVYSLRAQVTDAAGNASALSPAVGVTLDTQGPAAPGVTIAEAADGYINDAEAISGGGSAATLSLPTGAAAGDTIALLVNRPGTPDTTIAYTLTVGDIGAGTATINIPTANLTTDGAHSVTATITDSNGNVGATSAAATFTLDRTPPGAPSAPNLTAGSDTGSSNTDNVTRDTTPTFSGNGAAGGASIRLFDTDGTTVIGTGTANGGGVWNITAGALAPGVHTVTARQVDAAGNLSAASPSLAITIDTQSPTFIATLGTTEGFASQELSAASLAAADDSTAQGALAVTAATFQSATGFVAGDFSILVSGGQATLSRGAGAVNKSGSVVVAVTLEDLAGNEFAQDVTLNVAAVNDAPAGADATVVTLQNVPLVLTAADFGLTDVNDSPANVLLGVRIDTLPGAGQLTVGGAPVVAGQEVSAADIGAGSLVFTPNPNEVGTGYASFAFRVRDDGGTTSGGVDLDPTANSLTIDVASSLLEPFGVLPEEPAPLALALLLEEADGSFDLVYDGAGNLVSGSAGTSATGGSSLLGATMESAGEGTGTDLLQGGDTLSGSSLASLG